MKKNNINGVLLINKEKDYTSRDVVNILNKLLCTKKIGHTGTLDPLATGVLVICIGKYTKLVDEITSYDKTYKATIKLGIKTDTGDITGNIIKQKNYEVNENEILDVFQSIKGKMIQTVPIYSAIKIKGKKLYEYARNNETVELPKREVEIFDISLISFENDEIKFETKVSKGTYIRSLIEDICEKLGTVGTMSELSRTAQGNFKIEECYTISDIENNDFQLVNIEKELNYVTYDLNSEEYNKVLNGCKLCIDKTEDKILLIYKKEIIAIYKKVEEIYKPYVMLKTI